MGFTDDGTMGNWVVVNSYGAGDGQVNIPPSDANPLIVGPAIWKS